MRAAKGRQVWRDKVKDKTDRSRDKSGEGRGSAVPADKRGMQL